MVVLVTIPESMCSVGEGQKLIFKTPVVDRLLVGVSGSRELLCQKSAF